MTLISNHSKKVMVSSLILSLLSSPLAISSVSAAAGTPQPEIASHVKNVLNIDGKTFKDLNGNGSLDPYEDWRLSTNQRVADLLPRMSMAEKAGIMQITSLPSDINGINDFVNNRHIHYLIIRDNITALELAKRANKYQEVAEATPLGIPLVFTSNPRNHVSQQLTFGISEASGQFSTWPGTLGLAATGDLSIIRDFAEIAREEWRSSGIQKTYGYQVEIASEPRWNRISGTFGEGTELNSKIARELVLGFQGEKLGNKSVAQTIKHFVGDGAVVRGLDPHNEPGKWATYPTEGSLFKYQLPPFQAAIDAGVSSIMSYYNVPSNALSAKQLPDEMWFSKNQQFEEVAGAYNKTLITDILRNKMGFSGYVNTDSGPLTTRDFGVHDLTIEQKFAKSIHAGANIFSDNNDPSGLISAVNTGLLREEELNPSVAHLLTEMFDLGLFENPYTDPNKAQMIASSPASQARADEAHHKSITLLRNNKGLLPLSDASINTKKLYVEVFNGNNSATQTTALKKLITDKDPSVTIVNTLAEANTAFVWALPTIYAYPDNSSQEIQLSTLTGIDVNKIKQIEAAVLTVLAINMTNPWVVNEIEPGAAAVVATYDVKGEALLDVLRGRYNPTGILPITIPANQTAVENNASDVPGYAENFHYAYTNAAGDDYSFGFGLSYGARATLAGSSSVPVGKTFSLNYGLKNVTQSVYKDVYAQDLTLNFDPAQMEFVDAQSLNTGLSIVSKNVTEPGKVRILLASLGASNAITTDGDFMKLQFKAKATAMTPPARVTLSNIVLSNGIGNETQVANVFQNVKISFTLADLNGDSKVTIGDLGIVAAAFGKTSSSPDWARYMLADVNNDGKVDIVDLAIVAHAIN
ncbi:glycoside hydrolase family 3 N-terminal domain-containing protein [Paenibacillus aceris]|uniref:beta-glucosidase n=1 Tax=Paenibacillus aceris TaxID=869555 RepID=A0ABS4HX78_9BACL|nr:glycoside hydrolase family 3 N-terminal domain-containing protein [Paenibacillus aceris]MBP1963250.1 beta-glucosidase [Paenibacillus aceris]NHW38637.1 glycoside hydrolase family 3 protein [Paenibacillus aceris]